MKTATHADEIGAAHRFAERLFVMSRSAKTTFSACPRLKPLECLVPPHVYEHMRRVSKIDAEGWIVGRDVAGDELTPRLFADASIDANHAAVSPIVFHIICTLILIADQIADKRGWKTA